MSNKDIVVFVTKIHSNYYYVVFRNEIWECMLRSKLKKAKQEVKVGDKVLIEDLNFSNKTAVISKIFSRQNELEKPNIANVDQAVIICSTLTPNFSSDDLDKYLVLIESNKIKPIICINKSDLLTDELRSNIDKIYQNSDYKIIYTSAKNELGFDELIKVLKNKISVFVGASGVGKSTVLNKLDSNLKLATQEVSGYTGTGRHTTRHVSLQKINFGKKYALIADTPGFRYIEFKNIKSLELAKYFPEFKKLRIQCKLRNCLHWKEPDCKIKEKFGLDNHRYLSYLNILNEVREFEKINKKRSLKKENNIKISERSDGKKISVVKLEGHQREISRRSIKQELSKIGEERSLKEIEENDYIF